MQGYIHSQLGKFDKAREFFNHAVSIQDYNAGAYYYLGLLDEHDGKFSAATDNYHKSLELQPNDPTGRAYQRLSKLSERQGKLDEMYYYMGCNFDSRNMLDDAACRFQRVLDINPQFVEAYIGLGNTLRKLKKHEDAISSYEKALACNPSLSKAHRELGITLGGIKQFEAGLRCLERALSLQPDDAESHYWKAITLLMLGRLSEGWDEYEWRMKWNGIAGLIGNRRDFKLPFWQGEQLDDKAILVCGEQGIGDEIMFTSCINDLISTAGHVVIECDNRLATLMKRTFPAATVAGRYRDGDADWLARLPRVEYRISAGSLPRIFRRSLDRFPKRDGFLVPDTKRVQRWRDRYKLLGPGLNIGISWTGGKTPQERLSRSAPLEQWTNIFGMPGINFISLQYGDHADELALVEKKTGAIIHDWQDSDPLVDMEDFAAKIVALDLVISIDNSTIHMAGALGVQAWSLLPYVAEWRWMLDRTDSPWYPTLKLFRQQQRDDWTPVFEQIVIELRRLQQS